MSDEVYCNSNLNDVIDEIVSRFKLLKPPFICPVDNCAKPCLGLMSLKHHLSKTHKDRLLETKQSGDEAASDDNDGDICSQSSESRQVSISVFVHATELVLFWFYRSNGSICNRN